MGTMVHSRGHPIQQGHQEGTDEKGARISHEFSGHSVLQAAVDTRKGCHRAWFVNDKVW